MTGDELRPGVVVSVGADASVQFARFPFRFRIIRLLDPVGIGAAGWQWLDGEELDSRGKPICRREIYVNTAGLHPVHTTVAWRPRPPRRLR